MLEHGMDQATGLRRILPRRSGGVVLVAGALDHLECTTHLLRALASSASRLTVMSDLPALLERLPQGRGDALIETVLTRGQGSDLSVLAQVADPGTWTLVLVDDDRLSRGLGFEAREALVMTDADTEGLATSYLRIKALVEGASVRELSTVFTPGWGGGPARRGHARLARTAGRFLGVSLRFVGCAPQWPVHGAYQRLAEGVVDSLGSLGEAKWRPH